MNDADNDSSTTTLSVGANAGITGLLWGPQDTHRRMLERQLGVRLGSRGGQITISGGADEIAFARRVLEQLLRITERGAPLGLQDIDQAVRLMRSDVDVDLDALAGAQVLTTHDQRSIVPKTPNQRAYLDAIARDDLVFAIGPAGTGKTYLAMAAAVAALKRKEVKRIVLARPAVEAGERLGFLPGTLTEKVNPYLRPLYDALYDLMDVERARKLVESGVLEVAPLAYMRGRTLNNAFVILDEAQNTTRDQMKMFLTRLGYSSKAVVTGDVTQVDLPANWESGLQHAVRVLVAVEGIGRITFTHVDVVRHPLVQAIIQAYDVDEDRGPKG